MRTSAMGMLAFLLGTFSQVWVYGQSVTLDPTFYKSVQERAGQESSLAIAMSLSGGGHRAANLGLGVMLALENYHYTAKGNDTIINLLKEIDYFSGVSGGSWAAGAYLAHLIQSPQPTQFSLSDQFQQTLQKRASQNYQKTLFWNLFNPVLWFNQKNTGDYLEKAIDKKLLSANTARKSISLGDYLVMRDQSISVRYPYFTPNTTNFQSYERVPFSPDVLAAYQIKSYYHRLKKHKLPNPELQLMSEVLSMPLAAAIKASSSFPIAIPVSIFETSYMATYQPRKKRYLRLTDGGIAENMGYKTALEWLDADKALPGRYLLVVDAHNQPIGSPYTYRSRRPDPFTALARTLYSGLFSKYNMVYEEIYAQAELEKVQVIPLHAYTFVDSIDRSILRTYARQKESIRRKDAKELLSRFADMSPAQLARIALNPKEKVILFDYYTQIGTQLKMSKLQQQAVLMVGFTTVKSQKAQWDLLIEQHLKAKQKDDYPKLSELKVKTVSLPYKE